jgi:probable rRNA maturation factor
MINIEVVSENNLWKKKIRKNFFFFKTLISLFPKKYRFIRKKVSLTILLSDNKNIKILNKKFRNKNKPTDVLSFPSEKKTNIKKIFYLGDIIISYEFINKPKTINNLEFKKRVIRTFIHGFLHLLGYDHIKLKDFKKMIKEEERIYKIIETKITKLA